MIFVSFFLLGIKIDEPRKSREEDGEPGERAVNGEMQTEILYTECSEKDSFWGGRYSHRCAEEQISKY